MCFGIGSRFSQLSFRRPQGIPMLLDQNIRTPKDRLIKLVEQLLADQPARQAVSEEDRLTDIGLSSIKMVNLMLEVEAEFDICIPHTDITAGNFRSVSTMEALVLRLCGRAIGAD
jgi:acyl carrier protein